MNIKNELGNSITRPYFLENGYNGKDEYFGGSTLSMLRSYKTVWSNPVDFPLIHLRTVCSRYLIYHAYFYYVYFCCLYLGVGSHGVRKHSYCILLYTTG